jgi:GMP synthase (glutamine-hydrolysing)
MKDYVVRRLFGVFMTCAVVCFIAGTAAAKDRGDTSGKSSGQDRRPWIMVALAPDGCSRGCRNAFNVIKELSGNPNGHILHFSKVTYELVAEMKPEFIILSPQGTPWCRYTGERGVALQNFFWMLPLLAEEMNIPMLGICGGHQALALAFGGKVGPIRAGEDDCMPYTRERQGGVIPLTLTANDPLFSGVGEKPRILESHYDEVKVLPPSFVLLASDKISRNQIIRHATRPVYGIQGHPEHFHGHRPDGGILIKNFLKIALDSSKIAASPNGVQRAPRLTHRHAGETPTQN